MSPLTQSVALLAQATVEESQRISIWNNDLLDQWRIPFGDWMEQAARWIAVNLGTLLDILAWPFDFLIRRFVRDFLVEIPWIWVVLAVALLAWLARDLKLASSVTVALFICGLLGDQYWRETAATLGFIGVAVFLCVVIGIPVGIACGRMDSVWNVTRPILDAMQVVHSFVFMLPFIWFFGLGEVSATMVTMVYAIPPLIRLTNLGIRQVAPDVVEASRAYGASERRVLFDVQIPLARPAIMTGINQTLLLSISMLGVAAIMGAAGLGRLLFRAINNQNVGLGASAGLAFFLVAVVLDRMSQREGTESVGFVTRIRLAWKHRRDPEALLPDEGPPAIVKHQEAVEYAPILLRERMAMAVALAGGAIAIASTLMPWTSDAGKISAWSRWRDASLDGELVGQAFTGLDASGGSWFGIIVLALGLFVILAVAGSGLRPGRMPRWLAADGAVIAAIALLITAVAHWMAQSIAEAGLAAGAVDPGTGPGVYLAIAAGAIASIGAVWWIMVADHSPLHPLPQGIAWGQLAGVVFATGVLILGVISGWSWDERVEEVITPEIQAEIDELERRAIENPEDSAAIAADMLSLRARATQTGVRVIDGISDEGARLGIWALIVGGLALLTSLPAAGVFGDDGRRRWRWCAMTAAIGAGLAGIGLAWVFTHVRSGHVKYVSGIGTFLTVVAGVLIVASARQVLTEYRRSRVYQDPLERDVKTMQTP